MTDSISLVLIAARVARLWLDDNSLRIRPHQRAEQRVPVCRLLRVHCYGDLTTGFDALLKLAEQHIPVTFFDMRGHVRSQLYTPNPPTKPLALWLEHCFCEEACQDSYRQWLDDHHLALLSHLNIHQGSLSTRQEAAQRYIHHWLQQHTLEAPYGKLYRQGKQLITAHLAEQLNAYGLPSGCTVRNTLFNDLQDLLEYWLQWHIIHSLQHFLAIANGMPREFESTLHKAIHEHSALLLLQLQQHIERYALDQL